MRCENPWDRTSSKCKTKCTGTFNYLPHLFQSEMQRNCIWLPNVDSFFYFEQRNLKSFVLNNLCDSLLPFFIFSIFFLRFSLLAFSILILIFRDTGTFWFLFVCRSKKGALWKTVSLTFFYWNNWTASYYMWWQQASQKKYRYVCF